MPILVGLCPADEATREAHRRLDWLVWTTLTRMDSRGVQLLIFEGLSIGEPSQATADLATLFAAFQGCIGASQPPESWIVEVHGSPPNFAVVSVDSSEVPGTLQTAEFRLVGSTVAVIGVREIRTEGATSCVKPVRPDVGSCRLDPAEIARIAQTATDRLAG